MLTRSAHARRRGLFAWDLPRLSRSLPLHGSWLVSGKGRGWAALPQRKDTWLCALRSDSAGSRSLGNGPFRSEGCANGAGSARGGAPSGRALRCSLRPSVHRRRRLEKGSETGALGTERPVRREPWGLEKAGETGALGAMMRREAGGGGGLHPDKSLRGSRRGRTFPTAQLAVVSTSLGSPAQKHPLPSSYPTFVKGNFQSIIFLCPFLNLRI